MTSAADTVDGSVCILIDEWHDGYVEDWAWVKLTTLTPTPESAIDRLQSEFPVDEQRGGGGEGAEYICRGTVWKRPVGLPDEDGKVKHDGVTYYWPEVPWEETEEGAERADQFWKIELVEHA